MQEAIERMTAVKTLTINSAHVDPEIAVILTHCAALAKKNFRATTIFHYRVRISSSATPLTFTSAIDQPSNSRNI